MMAMSPVRFRIRELRVAKGWSQARLADASKTRQATISDLESGRSRRVEIDLLQRLADALGVEPGELVERAKPKKGRK
jgi:transcriptional regulator with XRE-family HTH domain